MSVPGFFRPDEVRSCSSLCISLLQFFPSLSVSLSLSPSLFLKPCNVWKCWLSSSSSDWYSSALSFLLGSDWLLFDFCCLLAVYLCVACVSLTACIITGFSPALRCWPVLCPLDYVSSPSLKSTSPVSDLWSGTSRNLFFFLPLSGRVNF